MPGSYSGGDTTFASEDVGFSRVDCQNSPEGRIIPRGDIGFPRRDSTFSPKFKSISQQVNSFSKNDCQISIEGINFSWADM